MRWKHLSNSSSAICQSNDTKNTHEKHRWRQTLMSLWPTLSGSQLMQWKGLFVSHFEFLQTVVNLCPLIKEKKKLQIALPADYKPYANVTLCCGTWIWVWGRVPRLNWRMSVTTVVNQSRVSAPSFTFIFHSCCLFKRKKKRRTLLWRTSFPANPWFYNCQLPASK